MRSSVASKPIIKPQSNCHYLYPNQACFQSANLKKRGENHNKNLFIKNFFVNKFRIKDYICLEVLGFI